MTIVTTGGGGPLGFMDDPVPIPITVGGEFNAFCAGVYELLQQKAKDKQYNATGTEGPNPLYEFVRSMTGSDAHALGEIIYKAKRFSATGQIEDVLKIAAWAFLVWKYNHTRPYCVTPPLTQTPHHE